MNTQPSSGATTGIARMEGVNRDALRHGGVQKRAGRDDNEKKVPTKVGTFSKTKLSRVFSEGLLGNNLFRNRGGAQLGLQSEDSRFESLIVRSQLRAARIPMVLGGVANLVEAVFQILF